MGTAGAPPPRLTTSTRDRGPAAVGARGGDRRPGRRVVPVPDFDHTTPRSS
ncbi:hypothetical protein AB0G02_22265 [Actinosynnema sp. NPDC023658]|uniref:hypothetical protein n=1 Tax=Actinosynnema sp. NPDC023658 TaxID=3155465 RepID=UPI00340D1DBF